MELYALFVFSMKHKKMQKNNETKTIPNEFR